MSVFANIYLIGKIKTVFKKTCKNISRQKSYLSGQNFDTFCRLNFHSVVCEAVESAYSIVQRIENPFISNL